MKTRAFQSGNSIAVRIPQQFGVEPGSLLIHQVGEMIILMRPAHSWREIFANLKGGVSDDFLSDRKELPFEKREDL